MPSDDAHADELSRSDGAVAASVTVLCTGCNTSLNGEDNGLRHCPRCDITVHVQCDVEVIDDAP